MSGVQAPIRPVALGKLQPFSVVGTPLLSKGSSMALVSRAPGLWMHIKVYNDGGENALHSHPHEDHMFFILAGQATFYDAEGATQVLGPNEGMTVPRGVFYSFVASSDENLVMLRIGSAVEARYAEDKTPGAAWAVAIRHHPDGTLFSGEHEKNKTGAERGAPSGAAFGRT